MTSMTKRLTRFGHFAKSGLSKRDNLVSVVSIGMAREA